MLSCLVHIKEPLLLIGKSSPCGGSGYPLSLSEWSFTICPTPYNMFLVRNISENWHRGARFFYVYEIHECRANRAPVAMRHLFDTSLFNHSHWSTGFVGAVVKLSDLRLVGTEIESWSRHGIFFISVSAPTQSECSAMFNGKV